MVSGGAFGGRRGRAACAAFAATAIAFVAPGPAQGDAGDLDPAFGDDGVVISAFDFPKRAFARYDDVVVTSGGQIVAGGFTEIRGNSRVNPQFVIARFNADGTPDAAFGDAGKVTLQPAQQGGGLAVDHHGRVLTRASGSEDALTRLSTGGQSDSSFGNAGAAPYGARFEIAIAIDSEGRILVGGESQKGDFSLTRLDDDGQVDSSFGAGGTATTNFGGRDVISEIDFTPDGQIVAAGRSDGFAVVARYTSQGQLDTTFDVDGKAAVSFTGTVLGGAEGLAVQDDGKVLVSGRTADRAAVARLSADGSPDQDFGSAGERVLDPPGTIVSGAPLTIASNGRIFVAPTVQQAADTDRAYSARLDSAGTQVGSFKLIDAGGLSSSASDLAAGPGARVMVAGGVVTEPGSSDFALTALRLNGDVETEFGDAGSVVSQSTLDTPTENAFTSVIADDTRSLASARLGDGGLAIEARTNEGELDPSWSGDGRSVEIFAGEPSSAIERLVALYGGDVLAVGSVGDGSNTDIAVSRYQANGTLDQSFDGDGTATFELGSTPAPSDPDVGFAATELSDGDVVVAGTGAGSAVLLRIEADGSLDDDFGESGIVEGANGSYIDVGITDDGDIYALRADAVERFDPNGDPDPSFAGDGSVALTGEARALAVQYGTRVLVGFDDRVERLTANGGFDANFDGVPYISPTSGEGSALAILRDLETDFVGNVVTVGTGPSGIAAANRFDPDGAPDRGFGDRGLASAGDGGFAAVALRPAGSILAAGATRPPGGVNSGLLAQFQGGASPANQPPETELLELRRKRNSVGVYFRSTDDRTFESDLSWECKLDDRSWKPCSSPRIFQNLDRSRHTTRIRAIDDSGLVEETPLKVSFRTRRG